MKHTKTNAKKIGGFPLGVVERDGEVCMLVRVDGKTTSSISLLTGHNGVDFIKDSKKVSIEVSSSKKEKIILR